MWRSLSIWDGCYGIISISWNWVGQLSSQPWGQHGCLCPTRSREMGVQWQIARLLLWLPLFLEMEVFIVSKQGLCYVTNKLYHLEADEHNESSLSHSKVRNNSEVIAGVHVGIRMHALTYNATLQSIEWVFCIPPPLPHWNPLIKKKGKRQSVPEVMKLLDAFFMPITLREKQVHKLRRLFL